MVKKLTMMFACLFLSMGMAMAQTQASGTVVSSEDGQPVIGASVMLVGSNTGTVTDNDGKFTLSVPANGKLRISSVGMQTQEVTAGQNMKIVLMPEDNTLDEVVVTALGIKRSAKALGFSATAVKGEDIAAARTNDIMSSLQGKVAGVQISNSSSDPGSSKSVIVRGVSSLGGTNQPLYVIDGVPLTNAAVYSSDGLNKGFDFGNGASAVNPDDVESMTILKGAAATALYGSRAANGVILITTKVGARQKKGFGIEYNGGLQWETLLRLPQMQNEFGMGWYGEKTDNENGSWGPAFDGSLLRYGNVYDSSQKMKSYVPIKNNIKDFFDVGFRYNNSVSFNGATDVSTFFVSLSQIHEDGIIPTDADNYSKYTFSARGSHKVNNLTFSTSLNYAYQKNNFVSTGQGASSMYNNIMQTPRDISIVELENLDDPFNSPGYYFTPYGVTNPYYILKNFKNEYEAERFYGKFQLDYDFLKYFKMTYRFGLDTSTGHQETGAPNLSAIYAGTPNWADALRSITGYYNQNTSRRREINQDIMFTFDKDMIEDLHLNALLGFNGNERTYSWFAGGVTNLTIPTWFNLGNSAEKPIIESYKQKRRLMGVFGQAEVAYKNMLYLTLTARNDWSSTLPKDNRSFFYPGVTASWIFSEMFNDNLKGIISYGKFRAAWGKTGNDANPYMTGIVFAQSVANSSGWADSSFPFTKGNWNAYTLGNILGSNTLSPEMTTETELGLNMMFLQNRIGFDLAFYNRESDKQIFSLDMDASSGFRAQNMNLGKIRNRGIELMINATPIKIKDFSWDIVWNFTKNWSKVISLPESLGGSTAIWAFTGGTGLYAETGKELGLFKAYVPVRDDKGNIVVDKNGLPVKDPVQKVVGSMNYKYQMGFNNTFSYKGVSLSVDIDIRKGGVMFSRTKNINYFVGNAIQTTYNNRNPWIIPNSVVQGVDADGNTVYTPNTTPLDATNIYNYWNNGGDNLDAAFLVDKSYVKLRSVVLSWDLPSKWLANTFLTGVRMSFFGNNLLLWTPSENTFIDPEMTSFGNDLQGNFGEYSANPSSRKFGFNVTVKF
ncbi:MAG: SusC/RagA family TonB-linked outer membrane protein [Prevotella sp.]|uniref:SusC/RagA family TonB-linked outer membrane protein n=1 Tax=Prevotella sp. TaxID=59823 RepID=UPI002A2C1567|nr:SusC/RagA family TonB-linked outer membrane protein [Prevotella sp.]MDD7317840.1 SusC/RagA family TonB-linked outer membrane protein [Prevotellaceae bacterium]MDY4020755.1 SusC/RagA family TonB-linked outer membrane protein [Prevotella sp.]